MLWGYQVGADAAGLGDRVAEVPTWGMTIHQRFLSKVVLSQGCWLWGGYLEENGYGRLTVDGKPAWAHRVAYELFVGPVPEGMELDHLCRNRRCVNPRHLEPVSHQENMCRSPVGAAAFHRSKTHCPQGHPYSGDNLIIYRGMRYCRECQRRHKREYKARKRSSTGNQAS